MNRPIKLVGVHVKRHDIGAAPVDLEGMPSCPTAEVEHAVTWTDAKPAEIDGQQGSAPFVGAAMCGELTVACRAMAAA